MVEPRTGQVIAWVAAAFLVLLLAFSLTGDGTWMGGIGMGWMMTFPIVLLIVVGYLAYRYGRAEQKVEDLKERKS